MSAWLSHLPLGLPERTFFLFVCLFGFLSNERLQDNCLKGFDFSHFTFSEATLALLSFLLQATLWCPLNLWI